MFKKSTSRYTYVAIALHWAIAALILFMIWLGWNMDENESRYQLHKSIGITILLLSVARVLWRRMNPPPRMPEGITPLEAKASHFVHMAFYVLMIAMPLAGWFMVSISKFQVPTVLYGVVSWPSLPFTSGLRGSGLYDVVAFMHSKSAWLIIGMLVLHVGGALKHQFVGNEAVLKRMLPRLLGPTRPPKYEAQGHGKAFGAAAVLFLAVVGTPMVAKSLSNVTTSIASNTSNASAQSAPAKAIEKADANWQVDYAASEIRFAGTHDGKPFSGVFETWSADVAFYPESLETSEVSVIVNTGSAKTGRKLYDDSLKAEEWFNRSTYPEARVRLSDFKRTADGYTSNATLTLKGIVIDIPLNFELDINGSIATLTGETTLSREPLKLGQNSDPGAQWVSEDVFVTVSGIAYEIQPGTERTDIGVAPMPEYTPEPIPEVIDAAYAEPVIDTSAFALSADEIAPLDTPIEDVLPVQPEPILVATEPEVETIEVAAPVVETEITETDAEGVGTIDAAGAELLEMLDATPDPAPSFDPYSVDVSAVERAEVPPTPSASAPLPPVTVAKPTSELVLDEYTLRQLTKKPEPVPVPETAE